MLVVIAIIAVLMGLAFPAFQSVQNSAKRTQAKNDLVQIVTAVKAYSTEYGKFPLATWEQGHDVTFAEDSYQDQIFNVLRANGSGRDNPNSASADDNQNPRRITFLSVADAKDAKNPKAGIVPNNAPSRQGMFVDPWGTPYVVKMDGNYDNALNNPYGLNAGSNPLRADVIAWSLGKNASSNSATKHLDATAGGSDFRDSTNADDVISW